MASEQTSPQMCSNAEYCNSGVIKHQTPLKKNLLNGEKVKGSQPLPRLDKDEIGPETKVQVKSMQTQFKIMRWAVAKYPSVKLQIMGESVPSLLDSGSMASLTWQDHFN